MIPESLKIWLLGMVIIIAVTLYSICIILALQLAIHKWGGAIGTLIVIVAFSSPLACWVGEKILYPKPPKLLGGQNTDAIGFEGPKEDIEDEEDA